MSGIKSKDLGVYNAAQRYNFKNILEEDFTFNWNKEPITIKAGQTVSLPEYLADKMLDAIVDKIMITEIKTKEVEYYQKNPNTAPNFYRHPSSLGVPAARKVWEDQIITKLAMEEGSTEAQLLRMQIKEQLETDLKMEVSTEPVQVPQSAVGNFSDSSLAEFAEISPKNKKSK